MYDWRNGLPDTTVTSIESWFDSRPESDDCTDGHRVARVGDSEAEKTYEEVRANGCCGFVDETLVVDGVLYLVGFNYGH